MLYKKVFYSLSILLTALIAPASYATSTATLEVSGIIGIASDLNDIIPDSLLSAGSAFHGKAEIDLSVSGLPAFPYTLGYVNAVEWEWSFGGIDLSQSKAYLSLSDSTVDQLLFGAAFGSAPPTLSNAPSNVSFDSLYLSFGTHPSDPATIINSPNYHLNDIITSTVFDKLDKRWVQLQLQAGDDIAAFHALFENYKITRESVPDNGSTALMLLIPLAALSVRRFVSKGPRINSVN